MSKTERLSRAESMGVSLPTASRVHFVPWVHKFLTILIMAFSMVSVIFGSQDPGAAHSPEHWTHPGRQKETDKHSSLGYVPNTRPAFRAAFWHLASVGSSVEKRNTVREK